MKTVKLHTTILCLALLSSCKNTSTLQKSKQEEPVKILQSQLLKTKMSAKQYDLFKKQIRNESELLKKIHTAESQFTYTTYHYMQGATTLMTLLLGKNGTGYIKNITTNSIHKITWIEQNSVIYITATADTSTLPFNKLKRIDRKTLMYQSENNKHKMLFYGKLNDEDILEILNVIENISKNRCSKATITNNKTHISNTKTSN
ncbi:hypothetical protein Q4517_13335 [Tenacibaculum sp. 1_MG-2023]|uniref:hypothetical protein n=1 Tax=Tenacibaculum sp. 1_MG-2023 TaxID=3062653 RepID=UPI0026E2AE23|nr:hypothetical protein [Tenacibaculum sp. 1_MG-2023]MDO6676526.1 hypothetical protein [Tenacibaculum sp. 1_MG-2023]